MNKDNPTEDFTINDLDLLAYMAHLHIFASLMAPLDNISTNVDTTMEESWKMIGSVSSKTMMGPILREAACIYWKTKIHASVAQVKGEDNQKSYAASILTYLTVDSFNSHFNGKLPHQETWWMSLLPCAVNHHMLTILHTHRLLQDCPLPPCRKNPPSGRNGRHSAHGCASQHILRELRTQYHSPRF